MAGKGRRTASRQAQLNRKRKKTQKGPSGIPSTDQIVADSEDEASVAVLAGVENAELEAPEAMEAAGSPVAPAGGAKPAPRASRPSPVARTPQGESAGQGRLRGERPAAYLYVGAELRRIMVLTAAILAALIVLGIVL